MNDWKNGSNWIGPAALIVAVFVSGALSGAAGVRWLDRDAQRDATPTENVRERGRSGFPRGEGPPGGERFFVDQVAERLDLTDAQRAQVDSIVQAQRTKSRQVMEALRPAMRASLDSMNAAIAEVLEPEQQAAWEEFVAEASRRHDRRGGPPDRRRGRGPGH